MKSAITDDMKSQRMILRHSPRRYDFPRYGNFYSDFSTLWKIFFHSMENVGRATARTRRGRCCYQEPSPRIGDKMHNKALHRTAHKVRRPVKADVRTQDMMKYIYILILMATLLWGCQPRVPLNDVDEIVQKHLIACGGADKLRAIHSSRVTGQLVIKMESGTIRVQHVIESKRRNKSRAEYTFPKGTMIRAYDGTTGWIINPGEQKVALMPEAERITMDRLIFDTSLLDYEKRGNKVLLAGLVELPSGPAYKLLDISIHGETNYHYIDAVSFLAVQCDTLNADGSISEDIYRHYKSVDGIMKPTEYEMRTQGEPDYRAIAKIEKIELNVEIPDERFQMPSSP
jgi:outer membrane lipoprotein-sorting protein